jgi:hypothetical protein
MTAITENPEKQDIGNAGIGLGCGSGHHHAEKQIDRHGQDQEGYGECRRPQHAQRLVLRLDRVGAQHASRRHCTG